MLGFFSQSAFGKHWRGIISVFVFIILNCKNKIKNDGEDLSKCSTFNLRFRCGEDGSRFLFICKFIFYVFYISVLFANGIVTMTVGQMSCRTRYIVMF